MKQIGYSLTEVIPAGEQAGQIDKMRPGIVDYPIGARCAGCVINDIQVKGALHGGIEGTARFSDAV
jgi:hypothetical protein